MADEYIKREDAIKAVDNLCHVYYPANKAKLEAIPSADVQEVRHGEWKHHTFNNGLWANYCSECGAYLPYGIDWQPDFCPDCGARMDG